MTATSSAEQVVRVALPKQPPIAGTGPVPVILRELLTEARKGSNYWLRLLGAIVLAALFVPLMWHQARASLALSIRLFADAHTVLFVSLWTVGPWLTADAISRERREGTLGFLFGTALTARGIVLGKCCVHMVRLLTLWLAALPVLVVPVLFGGVTGLDLASAFGLELSAIFWAIAAGMMASSIAKSAVAASLLAELISLGLMAVFQVIVTAVVYFQLLPLILGRAFTFSSAGLLGFAFSTGFLDQSGWSRKLRTSGATGDATWLCIVGEILGVSILAFCLLLALAAHHTQRVWQERPASARQLRIQNFWLAPRYWKGWFSRRRARWLDRDPLGWLHQYSTGMRVSHLGWCGLVLLVESAVMLSPRPWEYFDVAQIGTSLLLAGAMTLNAVMILRREQENGMLELLLVTPLPVHRILFRECRAFWRKFFLPVFLLLALAEWMVRFDMAQRTEFDIRVFLLVNFFTVPFIGSYGFAQFGNLAGAVFFTALFSLGLPLVGPSIAAGFMAEVLRVTPWSVLAYAPQVSAAISALFQLAIGLWAAAGLLRLLANRNVVLARSAA
jgi:ABC-type transport system involved in multi-copper enzyme maturation permease subunit